MAVLDGWIDWAEKLPASLEKTNNLSQHPPYPGPNPVQQAYFHSAEGYWANLLNLAVNGPYSWHGSIALKGKFTQHYPLHAKVWHATAANNISVGFEFEGVHTKEKTFTSEQINTAVRILRELAGYNGFTPSRPANDRDTSNTLWEHREVVKIGGSATACPSGRVPWDAILAGFYPQPPTRQFIFGSEESGYERRGFQIIHWNNYVEIYKYGSEDGFFPGQTWYHAGDNPDGTPNWIKLRD